MHRHRPRPTTRSITSRLLGGVAAACLAGCGLISGLTDPGSATERTITLRSLPSELPEGGGTVEIEAELRVGDGPEIGVPVSFRATAGTLVPASTVLTDASGIARLTLDTLTSGEVSASVFAGGVEIATSAALVVRVGNEPVSYGDATIKLGANPAPAATGEPVALTVRITRAGQRVRGRLEVDYGDGRVDGMPAFDRKAIFDHTYFRPDTFTLQVSITESDGRLTRRTFKVAVVAAS